MIWLETSVDVYPCRTYRCKFKVHLLNSLALVALFYIRTILYRAKEIIAL